MNADDSEDKERRDNTFNFTVSLPRRSSITNAQDQRDPPEAEDDRVERPGDEEWSWETDRDCGDSNLSPRNRRQKMQGSSREDSSTSSDSAGRGDASSSSGGASKSETRRLLTEMAECGAYNSDSLNCSNNSPGAGHSATSDLHSQVDHENSANWSSNDEQEHCPSKSKGGGGREEHAADGHLFDYLEETFKVLNGAYQIITGSSYNSEEEGEAARAPAAQEAIDDRRDDDQSFEEVLEGISSQCAILETELRSSASPRSASADWKPAESTKLGEPKNVARSKSQQGGSRPASKALLRPTSRQRSRPTSRQSSAAQATGDEEEEDWGDEDEWEYYYEEDVEEEKTGMPQQKEVKQDLNPQTAPAAGVLEESLKPQSKTHDNPTVSNMAVTVDAHPEEHTTSTTSEQKAAQQTQTLSSAVNKPESRPSSAQRKLIPSRPNSRSGSRPTSRASRMGRKTPMKGIGEEGDNDDEWEWEYYYEDDDDEVDELNRLSPCVNTAPTTRATSPFPLEPHREIETNKAVAEGVPELPMEEAEAADLHVIPEPTVAVEKFHGEVGLLDPISEVSVALAAEYLGQKVCQVAASLPQSFETKQGRVKSKSKSSKKERMGDEGYERKHKKRKKKKKRRETGAEDDDKEGEEEEEGYRPKLGVKDLVNMLEPRLFQDENSGTKMVMTREEAAMSKKFQDDVTQEEEESGVRRMTSVKQMAKRMSTLPQSIPEREPSLNSCNAEDPTDPMDAKDVGRVIDSADPSEVSIGVKTQSSQALPVVRSIPNASGKVEVIQGDTTTVVTMRNKSRARPPQQRPLQETAQAKSPVGSEAYGSGSSCSDRRQQQQSQAEPTEGGEQSSDEKKPNRHSRLFKLLQDSDYTDSETGETESSSAEGSPRVPRKERGSGNGDVDVQTKEATPADAESSLGSLVKQPPAVVAAMGRRHSLCSRESDRASQASPQLQQEFYKASPPTLRKEIASRRFMGLNLQTCYEPGAFPADWSGGDLSTPTSPVVDQNTGSLKRRGSSFLQQQQQQQHAASRVWSYHQDEFTPQQQQQHLQHQQSQHHYQQQLAVHDDSSYYSQSHSQLSLDSIATPDGFGVERRATVSREHSFRSLKGDPPPSSAVTGTSPKLERRNHINSPKIEMELQELANLPPLNLQGMRGNFGGGKM